MDDSRFTHDLLFGPLRSVLQCSQMYLNDAGTYGITVSYQGNSDSTCFHSNTVSYQGNSDSTCFHSNTVSYLGNSDSSCFHTNTVSYQGNSDSTCFHSNTVSYQGNSVIPETSCSNALEDLLHHGC